MPSPSKRGFLFWAAATAAALGILTLLATIPVLGNYRSKAVNAQRVEFDEAAASLFGDKDAYTEIGSPQKLIIEDQQAFLPGERNGAKLVSENYLRDKKIYPLQLKTVEYVGGLVRLGSGATLAVSLLLIAIYRFRRARNAGTEAST